VYASWRRATSSLAIRRPSTGLFACLRSRRLIHDCVVCQFELRSSFDFKVAEKRLGFCGTTCSLESLRQGISVFRVGIGKTDDVVGVVDIHAVAEMVVGKYVETVGEDSAYGDTERNVSDVIEDPSTVRIAGWIASDQSHAASLFERSWGHAGVESQKISDRSCRRSGRCDGRYVGHERQEILSRSHRDFESSAVKGFNGANNGWIQEESRELSIILRLVHAEAIFRTDTDEELVDEGVAHTLYLAPSARRG
jgi:hypothetical protein